MRCNTRLLLVTAFAIFAGLGLLAASTRTVAREPAPRAPAAQISSSEDDNDEAWDWLLKQASRNVEWWYALLRPWVHYVPISAHWADLRERLSCLRKQDALAARVAAEGRRLAQALSTDAALCFAWNVLQRASRLAPPEKWEALAKDVQRIAASGEHGLEMRPL